MNTLLLLIALLLMVSCLAAVAWLLNDALLQLLGRYPYDVPEDDDEAM